MFRQSRHNIPVGEIHGETKIGQTFMAEHDNLSAIEVLFGTYNRENIGVFYFHLKRDVTSKEDIFRHGFPISAVQDNEFFRFAFPKIANSKGKKYYFYLEAPKSQPGNAITIWSTPEDLYKESEKMVNGFASKGDLVFKAEYELRMKFSLDILYGNLIKIGKFFLNIFTNKIFYFLLILLALIWAFITFSKKSGILDKKLNFVLIYFVLFMILFIWIFASFSMKTIVFNQPINNVPVGEIYGDRKVGQIFVADYDKLSAIELLLATYKRKNTGEFIFHLRNDLRSEKDLLRYKGDISKVKDNRYFKFRFPEIKDSKGQTYYFYLEAPQSQPDNAITIWSNSEDRYQEGEKIVNGSASDGDLVFKTAYNLGFKDKFHIFLQEITHNKPSALNKKSFYIVLITLFLLMLPLFMTYLVKLFIEG